ncbi:MAG: glycosyltransferase [Sedimentisphaerales bacterium]|nr:glycosyltransferase [Sedimentisphaerales bacterium]
MAPTTVKTPSETAPDFAAMSAQIASLIAQARGHEADNALAQLEQHADDPAQQLLAGAMRLFMREQYPAAIEKFRQAGELLNPKSYPPLNTFYSQAFLKAQLVLPPLQRPAVKRGQKNLQTNLEALADIDASMADTVRAANWPVDLLLVEYWEGICLFSVKEGKVFSLDSDLLDRLAPILEKRDAPAFRSPPSYPALRHCLRHPYQGLHGMTRAHYLIEDNAELVQAFLHLQDVAESLRSRKLIIFIDNFASGQLNKKCREHFATLRYLPPANCLDSTDKLKNIVDDIILMFNPDPFNRQVNDYYQSAEFFQRRKDIISGRCQPRILIEASRWTTFLKYSAADFQRAFDILGCQTEFFIEENDVQTLSVPFRLQTLAEFKPDALFMVSHARPTVHLYPKNLSIISHIQDKCGPILQHNDLRGHIAPTDMLPCVSREHQRFLLQKNVLREQMFVLPIPANEEHFYPLPVDHPLADRFGIDISFVKHADGEKLKMFEYFLKHYLPKVPTFQSLLTETYTALYNETCQFDERRRYEDEMHQFVIERLEDILTPESLKFLERITHIFYLKVFSAAWRCQFLEALDQAGLTPALYGNDWDKHPRLKHAARGPAAFGEELNAVYNFSRINLHINQAGTMHTRLAECGLAGGFIMVADHPRQQDWSPARDFFEQDREIVFFDTCKDLIDKCRYYLCHDQERHDIAQRLRQRCLRERTYIVAVKIILDAWRTRLSRLSENASGDNP